MRFRCNPSCGCARCRAHGFMGPAVLITLGVLFLLDQLVTQVDWMRFHSTWPALLIVIGLIMFLQSNAPATGHVPREYMGAPPMQPVAQWQQQPPQQWHPPAPATPPNPAPGPITGSDNPEVHNG